MPKRLLRFFSPNRDLRGIGSKRRESHIVARTIRRTDCAARGLVYTELEKYLYIS